MSDGPRSENPMDLSGRRILVTGASSGIGRATAQLLSGLGARLVLVARNVPALEETLGRLEGDGHGLHPFDLADLAGIPGLLKAAAQAGPLSGVFHAAGIARFHAVSVLRESLIESVLSVDLKAALMLARGFCDRAVPCPEGGSLVFMSSVAASRGRPGMAVYSASKAAIEGAVRSLACELAPKGIRVNCIAAGAVETEMHEAIVRDLPEGAVTEYRSRHLLGFGQPRDVACAAAFLLSDAARWITGTTLVADGGYSCR